ncbi:MAG TPA: hypothetical protein VH619_05555 [Verrucomicrobiae bacterium]|jgi:hypothetical protein|nr:hypothetical protein [Verrucomicrobiae bacterium]
MIDASRLKNRAIGAAPKKRTPQDFTSTLAQLASVKEEVPDSPPREEYIDDSGKPVSCKEEE